MQACKSINHCNISSMRIRKILGQELPTDDFGTHANVKIKCTNLHVHMALYTTPLDA